MFIIIIALPVSIFVGEGEGGGRGGIGNKQRMHKLEGKFVNKNDLSDLFFN